MKTGFKYYAIAWGLLLLIFHLLVFLVPNAAIEDMKYTGSFWVGYVTILLCFVGQIAIVWFSVKKNWKATFYRLTLMQFSLSALVIVFIAGTVCMIVPVIPVWLGLVICVIAVALAAFPLLKTQAAISVVEEIDSKIAKDTKFIALMTMEAKTLFEKTSDENNKKQLKRLYEAFQYSDPMSNTALAGIEAKISTSLSELSDLLKQEQEKDASGLVAEIIVMTKERNERCKLLK